jgi:hypothetical protein
MKFRSALAILTATTLSQPMEVLAEPDWSSPFTQIAQNGGGVPAAQPAQPAASVTRGLPGFADTPWKISFNDARMQFKNLATSKTATERVEIVTLEQNHYILIRRNGILYRYNFYRAPFNVAKLYNHEITEEDYETVDARLFHVKVILPFLDSVQVKEKIESRFGPNTRTTVDKKKKRGVDIWELDGGLIFQWYEPYRGIAYSRTVDYISSEMAVQILKEYADYFDSAEKEILREVLLK